MLNNGRVLNFSAPQNLDCRLKLIKSLNGLLEEVRAKDMIPWRVGLERFSFNSNVKKLQMLDDALVELMLTVIHRLTGVTDLQGRPET